MSIAQIRLLLQTASEGEIVRPLCIKRLKVSDYEKYQADRIAAAKNLADNVYNLSNLDRVIDPEAYKNLFIRSLAGRSSEDNQFILKYAQQYFKEHFGEAIKKNGESPELIEQIVKRTGRDLRGTFQFILQGFNAPALAKKISVVTPEQTKLTNEIVKEIEALDAQQLKELKSEIKIIPARQIAALAHKFLDPQKSDLKSLQLLLQNKSAQEIKVIIEILEETYLLKEGEAPFAIIDWLRKHYAGTQLKHIKEILAGYNPEAIAELINWILHNGDTLWIDFAALQSQRMGKLVLHVQHNQNHHTLPEREIWLRPFILAVIYYLNSIQIQEVNQILQKRFQFEITPELYEISRTESALSNFLKLEKNISVYSDIQTAPINITLSDYRNTIANVRQIDNYLDLNLEYSYLLSCLLILYRATPRQFLEMSEYCQDWRKQELTEYLKQALSVRLKNYELENLLSLIESGLSSQEVFFEPISYLDFVIEKSQRPEKLKEIHEIEKKLNIIINNFNISAEEKALMLLKELQKLPKQSLIDLDYLYNYKNEINLLNKLKPLISPAALLKIQILLSGFNVHEFAKELQGKIDWRKLLPLSPLEIALVNQELNKTRNIQLLDLLEQSIEAPTLEIGIAFAYYPLASQLKSKILKSNTWQDLETAYILNNFTNHPRRLKALELAFNLIFSSEELGQELSQGPWRNSFLTQTITGAIKPIEYVQVFSLAEHIPITLIPEIYQITTASEKSLADLHALDAIFREHRVNLKIIKMLYLVFDGELSLRERIYRFFVYPRDEHLSLLLLDGYDPEALAKQLIIHLQASDLKIDQVYDLLEPSKSQLLPVKENWKNEMYHQLRIRYEIFSGQSLIRDLKKHCTTIEDQEILKNIIQFLYVEMADKCFALHTALSGNKVDPELILKRLKTYKPSQLEQLAHLYQSLYSENLEERLLNLNNEGKYPKIIKACFEAAYSWEQEKLDLKLAPVI